MAEDFKAISPKRSIKIVLHTGGVTRRIPEVTELFPEYEYEYKEDFQQKSDDLVESAGRSLFVFRNTFKKILRSLG